MNRRGVIAKCVALLASIAFSLAIVEVFARVYLAGAFALIPRYADSFQVISISPVVRKNKQSNLPWELAPNFDGIFKFTSFRTNSSGMRADRDFALEKPTDVYRVAVVGDSFSMPSGVEIEDAYHSVLERTLNSRSKRQFEFLNFAVGGYTLDNDLTVLKEKAIAFQPDHVLIGFCVRNDIPVLKTSVVPTSGSPEYSVMKLARPFYGYWTRNLIARAFPDPASLKESDRERDLEELDRILGEFKAIRDERRIEMTFALLRMRDGLDDERYQEAIRSLEKHGLRAVDTGTEFGPEYEDRYITTRIDQHPNALANQRFATALLREISWDRD